MLAIASRTPWENNHPLSLLQNRYRKPMFLELPHSLHTSLVLSFHMLLPMILPPKSPDNTLFNVRPHGVAAPVVRAEVLDCVVVNAVVVPLKVFGRGEASAAFFTFGGPEVVLLVTPGVVSRLALVKKGEKNKLQIALP